MERSDKALALLAKIRRVPRNKKLPVEYEQEFEKLFIPQVTSVMSSSFLRKIANALDVKYQTYFGRGRQAREIVECLKQYVSGTIKC